MQLTIESVQKTKSGKSLGVKAGGKDYLAKVDSGLQAGMVIDAETETSDYNGKSYTWITKYKAVGKANGESHASGGMPWLPMASNTVAHAINAGLIKEPSDVKIWLMAVKEAVEGAQADTPF